MNEDLLIQSAQRGDLEAFNQLILRYQNLLFSIALRVVADEDAASDALQEALISAFRKINMFRGGSLRSWLARIVINACYDELRRKRRQPTLPIEQLDADGDEIETDYWLTDSSVGLEEQYESTELERAIQKCLSSLPPDYRTVFVLVDVESMSYEEAAEAVHVPIGTVKSRLARARMQMRKALQSFGDLLPIAYRMGSPLSMNV
jgi:RNA polymerase sigma-70 factor (ECF subfamily)